MPAYDHDFLMLLSELEEAILVEADGTESWVLMDTIAQAQHRIACCGCDLEPGEYTCPLHTTLEV